MAAEKIIKIVIDWAPTTVLRLDPWKKLNQLWVRVKLVEDAANDDSLINQREVVETEWRQV